MQKGFSPEKVKIGDVQLVLSLEDIPMALSRRRKIDIL
jgi:hypothetical protein